MSGYHTLRARRRELWEWVYMRVCDWQRNNNRQWLLARQSWDINVYLNLTSTILCITVINNNNNTVKIRMEMMQKCIRNSKGEPESRFSHCIFLQNYKLWWIRMDPAQDQESSRERKQSECLPLCKGQDDSFNREANVNKHPRSRPSLRHGASCWATFERNHEHRYR